jgi:hypothetical protein
MAGDGGDHYLPGGQRWLTGAVRGRGCSRALWPDRDESTRTALETVFDARPELDRKRTVRDDIAAGQAMCEGYTSKYSSNSCGCGRSLIGSISLARL